MLSLWMMTKLSIVKDVVTAAAYCEGGVCRETVPLSWSIGFAPDRTLFIPRYEYVYLGTHC